jgi:hypothetical protein
MARSYYKGPSLGKLPACAICAGPGSGGRAEFHLPGGVVVWLCAEHRAHEFLVSRTGRDIVASLMHLWRAAGCFDRRRSKALDLHLERLRNAIENPRRPGSYSWPKLRREAEARFARGERPAQVIRHLRARHARDHAQVPSERTMRRWFADRRWLAESPEDGPPDPPGGSPPVAPVGPGPMAEGLPLAEHPDRAGTRETTRFPVESANRAPGAVSAKATAQALPRARAPPSGRPSGSSSAIPGSAAASSAVCPDPIGGRRGARAPDLRGARWRT